MRFPRSLALFTAFALLATTASAEFIKYSELRKDNPAIDEAIALLPNSDLHGTLNRISALLHRGQIRDLPTPTDYQDLPDNFVSGMAFAIQDLKIDLEEAVVEYAKGEPIIDSRSMWVLMQTVRLVLAERLTEISDDGIACEASDLNDFTCPFSSPAPLLNEFQTLFSNFGPLWEMMEEVLTESVNPPFSVTGTHITTYTLRVDVLVDEATLIPGNARVTGVPSIDP